MCLIIIWFNCASHRTATGLSPHVRTRPCESSLEYPSSEYASTLTIYSRITTGRLLSLRGLIMFKALSLSILLVVALVLTGITVWAQVPTGVISGTVTDESGAVIPSAAITITNKATGAARSVTANASGIFSASALDPGEYEVRSENTGFRTTVREATVTAGNTTTVDMAMRVGEAKEVVNVEAAAAQINYESHTVAGNIARSTIQELPLNGRGFLQLATLARRGDGSRFAVTVQR